MLRPAGSGVLQRLTGSLRALIAVLAVAMVTVAGTGCERGSGAVYTVRFPLTDSLLQVYDNLQQALRDNRQEQALACLDPTAAARVSQLTRSFGYTSLLSFFDVQIGRWPDLDTLAVVEVKSSSGYVRLAMAGPGTDYGQGEDRIRYTFLLYRRIMGQWCLSGGATIEKDRLDQYGNAVGYHETDLSPELRFPKLL